MYRNLLLASVAIVAMAPSSAEARSERRIVFNVAGGDLATVIDDIARQARTQILYDKAVVVGKTAPGVTGRLTIAQAVAAAVGNNGLVAQRAADGRIKVVAPGDEAADDIVVTAARGSFTATVGTTLTRTATPRRQTPGSIDVVTNDALEARNATSFEDILKNIPGVVSAPSGAGVQTALIRGDLTQSFQQGGLTTTPNGTSAPIGGLDHVEVFKGPSALLQGSAAGGGVINYVAKTGSLTPVRSITLTGGTNGFTQAIVDLGGPINAAGTLGFRLIGQSDHGQTNDYGFRNVYERLLTPKLRFKTDTTLVDIDYQYYEKRAGQTDFAYYTVNPAAPSHGTLTPYGKGLDRDAGTFNRSNRVAGSIEQTLVDTGDFKLQFRPRASYEFGTTELQSGGGYIPVPPDAYYLLISNYVKRKQLSAYGDLYAKFSTGPAKHQIIIGYDYQHYHADAIDNQAVFPFANSFPLVTAGSTVEPLPVPKADFFNVYVTKQQGYIAQDQIDAGPVHILAAIRHTILDQTTRVVNYDAVYSLPADQQIPSFVTTSNLITYQDRPSVHATRWDPSGGVVVDIFKQLSLYASYTSTFLPQLSGQATRSDLSALPPQSRKQYEVGAKLGLLDERLQFTASAYKYTTDNQPLTDPNNPRYAIDGPGRRAKGIELSATGAIDRSTNIIAGYGYVDVRQDLPAQFNGFTGALLRPALADEWAQGIPRHTANVFLTHDQRSGPLSGFGLGIGGNFTSGYGYLYYPTNSTQAIGDLSRAFVSLDGALRYSTGALRLNLTVTNILNRFNVYPSSIVAAGGSQIPIAPGRQGKLSMRIDF